MSVDMHYAKDLVPEIAFSDAAVKHLTSYLSKNPECIGCVYRLKKQVVLAYLM